MHFLPVWMWSNNYASGRMLTHTAELIGVCKEYVNIMGMIDSFLALTSQLQYPVKFGSIFCFFYLAQDGLDGFELLSSCPLASTFHMLVYRPACHPHSERIIYSFTDHSNFS